MFGFGRRLRQHFSSMSAISVAVGLAIVATLLAATTNGTIRSLTGEMHPFQIAFFRCVLALIMFGPLFWRSDFKLLKTSQVKLQLVAGMLQAGSMLLFFLALGLIPLAKVSALNFSSPLFATLLAIVFLGEVIRARRIAALIVGFTGMVLIVRPGWQPLDLGSIAVIASAACAGGNLIATKVLSRTNASMTTVFYSTLISAPVALVFAIPEWTMPSVHHIVPLLVIAAASSLNNVARAQAIKIADITIIAPLEFLKLPWSAVVGYVFFAELVDVWTWIGGFVIFAGATYIAHRERQIRSAGHPPAPHPPAP